jgi:predicted MPP superfamily phosphohydrolase
MDFAGDTPSFRKDSNLFAIVIGPRLDGRGRLVNAKDARHPILIPRTMEFGGDFQMEITWLHISDIHFYPKTEWRDSTTRSGFLTYLKDAFDRNDSLRPDLIFCTGDIAYGETGWSSLINQYGQAQKFFDELLHVCGRGGKPLSKDRLFVVPGNHDVNRENINAHAQKTLTEWAKTPKDHASTINQDINDRTKEFKEAVQRLSEYAQFVEEYLPSQHDPNERHCYTKIVDIKGLKVGIAGFNSAWTCAGPEDDRTIWLPAEWQFNTAREGIESTDLRIGLIHHPVDWFNEVDRDIATRRISTDFHFWLHGHSHNTWVVPAQTHVIIAAGAVGAQASEEFGINLVRINISKPNGTVDLHEHRAGDTSWKRATVGTHAPDGHWPFALPANLRTPSRAVEDEEYFEQDVSTRIGDYSIGPKIGTGTYRTVYPAHTLKQEESGSE